MPRQTRLFEFFTLLPLLFFPYRGDYPDKRGLSEKLLRRRLENNGWTIWRGGLIGAQDEYDIYPNVRRKYQLLEELLEGFRPGTYEELKFLAKVHHGMPDFICFRKGVFLFVECKYGHEQLSIRQKHCIRKLKQLGFVVEVHKLVENCTKTRKAMIILETGEKKILNKQLRIKQKY